MEDRVVEFAGVTCDEADPFDGFDSAGHFEKVGEGEYTWDGSGPLTLEATSLLGGNVVGEYPSTPPPAGGDPTAGHTLGDGDSVFGDTITFGEIPEPGSIVLLLTGLAGLAMCWWRRR